MRTVVYEQDQGQQCFHNNEECNVASKAWQCVHMNKIMDVQPKEQALELA